MTSGNRAGEEYVWVCLDYFGNHDRDLFLIGEEVIVGRVER